jgi:exodeoxyribonuclease X
LSMVTPVTKGFLPMRFACVDVETTGTEPTDQVIEIASALLENGKVGSTPKFRRLVCPGVLISPMASAVHHLTLQDVCQAPSWDEVLGDFIDAHRDVDALCAHNAAFERAYIIAGALSNKPWICTMKAAMRAWPDAPAFNNGTLRYWKNPAGLDRLVADQSHRAWPDAYVTAHLLRELLAEHDAETLIRWSEEPAMPPRLTFGKYRSMSWDDVDLSYLSWIVEKSDLDEDTKLCAKSHFKRRWALIHRETYVQVALEVIPTCLNSGDLEHWWISSKPHRLEHGIVEGTPEYAALVDACRQRREAFQPIA